MRPHHWIVLAAVVGCLSLPLQAQTSPILSASKAKKALKEAKAVEGRDPAKALELYRQVADQTAKTSVQRADALYAIALRQLARPAGERDLEAAQAAAQSFATDFPRDERRPAAQALAATLDLVATQQRDHAQQLATLAATAEAEAAAKLAAATTAKTETSQRVEELETRVRRLRGELEAAKTELAKKEEALQKLKKVVVGGGGY
jgi:hypothetical protein